jgi:hypothetical protein
MVKLKNSKFNTEWATRDMVAWAQLEDETLFDG